MALNPLADIHFESYYRMVRRALPAVAGGAVLDIRRDLLWSAQTADERQLGMALRMLRAQLEQTPVLEAGGWRAVQEPGLGVHALTLTDPQDRPAGTLALLVNRTEAGDSTGDPAGLLDAFRDCIVNEYALQLELEAMANELSERHEELNLVYDTDDQVMDIAGGRESLRQIVHNCVEFLDVRMAALILPELRLSFHAVNSLGGPTDPRHLLTCLREGVYTWSQIHRSGLVINDASHPLRGQLCPGVRDKILLARVIHGDEDLAGVLVIVNHAARRDFTNSDRSTLQVISKKVSKIIEASYDRLTRLLNDRSFAFYLTSSLTEAQSRGLQHCVLYVDLDHLQVINDIGGRESGDRLIQRVARTIRERIRDKDVVARLGGDAFGVLLEECPLEQGLRIAEEVSQAIREMNLWLGGEQHLVSVSIGLTLLDTETVSATEILNTIEAACQTAKEKGRGTIHVYQVHDRALQIRHEEMSWIARLQRAIREDRFELYGQEIRPLKAVKEDFYFEVLLRLHGEGDKVIAPGAFMPAAERYHLMPAIDRWVVEKALVLLNELRPILVGREGHLALNLSGQSLSDEGFFGFLEKTLDRSGVPPDWLCFEVTETAAIANLDRVKVFVSKMRRQGYRFSLDDFGTGLSSFAYLKELEVDYLKIDGVFVKEIVREPVSEAMVSAITQVGHVMGLEIIAEYVEDDAIKACLMRLGVDFAQGYGVARPAPLADQLKALAGSPPSVHKAGVRR